MMIKEKNVFHINGYAGMLIALVLFAFSIWLFFHSIVLAVILFILSFILSSGLVIVQPNEAVVLTFFGSYLGMIREPGLFMTILFTMHQKVSLRIDNFNSAVIKVNDMMGNPVEIAAVVVYKVVDTVQARFAVGDYGQFVEIQSESAVRHVASEYPYDTLENDDQLTLRGNPTEVSQRLTQELQDRLRVAGVEVVETRLTHLAYATEIAAAMLQKQQSTAILSARKIIVEGAVSITEDAIDRLAKETNLTLTDEQKLQVINNIMVAIISERGTQPVINTGE